MGNRGARAVDPYYEPEYPYEYYPSDIYVPTRQPAIPNPFINPRFGRPRAIFIPANPCFWG